MTDQRIKPECLRKTARHELFLDSHGNVTIRRFADGRYVWLSDLCTAELLTPLECIAPADDERFDEVMRKELSI